jgi:hypothetical protein
MKEVFFMEYIIHTTIKTLAQLLLVLGLTNLCFMFIPKSIRKTITGTFKFAVIITKMVITQLKKVVKTVYANYKEIEQPKKRKYSPRKNTNSKNVIQFPKANSK